MTDELMLPEIDPDAPRSTTPPMAPSRWYGALGGLVAGAAGVRARLVFAHLTDPSSPTDIVGSEFSDRPPGWLVRLAKDWFGTSDKRALRGGMFIVMTLIALFLGVRSLKDRWVGVTG